MSDVKVRSNLSVWIRKKMFNSFIHGEAFDSVGSWWVGLSPELYEEAACVSEINYPGYYRINMWGDQYDPQSPLKVGTQSIQGHIFYNVLWNWKPVIFPAVFDSEPVFVISMYMFKDAMPNSSLEKFSFGADLINGQVIITENESPILYVNEMKFVFNKAYQ